MYLDKMRCFIRTARTTLGTGSLFILLSLLVFVWAMLGGSSGFAITVSSSHSVSVAQYSDKIEASGIGSGIDSATWRNDYAVATTTNPTCSSTTFGTASSTANVVDITGSDVGKWVCFAVTHSTNQTIYGKHQITALGPAITITQADGDGDSLTATSSSGNLPATPVWQYSAPLTEDTYGNKPDCTDSNVSWFNGNKIKYIEYIRYYCFRVTDSSSNVGYARLKPKPPAVVLVADDVFQPPVGQNPPTRKITAVPTKGNIPGLAAGDHFGSSLAADGDRLVVGTPNQAGNSGSNTGSIYIYEKDSDGNWILEQRINDLVARSHFDYLSANDNFGQTVAISGDWLAVGAPGDDGYSGSNTGAVYIFKRDAIGWVIDQIIYDEGVGFTTLESADKFGSSLAISGDRLVIGAPGDDGHSGSDTGAVYIYKRTSRSWILERTIVDGSTGFNALESEDEFGSSLALDGRWLAVGAPGADGATRDDTGAVYIFKKTRSIWTSEQKIADESTDFKSLWAGDEFGSALSLDGRNLLVGAEETTWSSVSSGAAYVFTRAQYSDTFSFKQEISRGSSSLGATVKAGDNLGAAVDLFGDRLVVSANGDDTTGMTNTGAAYIFRNVGGSWTLEQELSYDVGSLSFLRANDKLGSSVVLGDGWLSMGAPLDDGLDGIDNGTVYTFTKDSNNSWSDQSQLRNLGLKVNTDSWQNFKTTDSNEPDCDSGDTFGTAASTADRIVSTGSSDKNKWACFRVQAKDASDVYSYVKRQFDYSGPSFSAKMDESGFLIVTGSDENIDLNPGWRVGLASTPGRGSSLDQLCDSFSRSWWNYTTHGLGSTKKIGYANYGAWVCVGLRDNLENYARARIQATLPITVNQTTTTATASVPEDINPDLSSGDQLGTSISLDGDWMVSGANGDDGDGGSDTGAVHIFKRTGTTWALKQKIFDQSSGFTALAAGDLFGTSVSLSGDRFAVGAPKDDAASKSDAGAVYIFKKGSDDVWSLEETIDANHTRDIKANAAFGQSVSLDGDYLAVGAPGHQVSAPSNDEVYIFKRNTSNNAWANQKKIDNSSTSLDITVNNVKGEAAKFGVSVALDGSYLAIGVPGYDVRHADTDEIISNTGGAISVFKRTGTNWSEVDYITERYYQKQSQVVSFIAEGDNFGTAVALDGDHLVVAAPGDDGRGFGTNKNYGAVHIFTRSVNDQGGEQWGHQKEIAKNEVPALQVNNAGRAIDLDGGRLAIGSRNFSSTFGVSTSADVGAVHIFTGSGNSWSLERKFTTNRDNNILEETKDDVYIWDNRDELGSSIALDGDYLVAGSVGNEGSRHEDSANDNFGAVYTFYKQDGYNWQFGNYLRANPVKLASSNPWGYFKTQTDATPSNCNSDGTFTDITSNSSSVTITNNDKWVCFRVKSPQLPGSSGNFISYHAHKILDLSGPTINLKQRNGRMIASGTGVPQENFEYFISSSDPTCSATNTTATYTINHFVENMTNGQYVCFRAQDLNGVYGYAKKQIDLNPPVISIHKAATTIEATSTDAPTNPVWLKKGPQSSSDCDSSTSNFSVGNSFSGVSNNKYYCFKLISELGNIGYNEIKIGTAPLISISQSKGNNEQARAAVSNVSVDTASWQNFTTDDQIEPNCNQDDESSFGTAGSAAATTSTTSADNMKWVCFRVKTTTNIYGYGKQKVDYDAPVVTVTRTGATTIAATTDATDLPQTSTWQKKGPNDTSDCDSSTTGFSSGKSYSTLTLPKYYCFRVTDKNDNDGYGEIYATNNPRITITQTKGSQDTVTARANTYSTDGIDNNSWQNFVDTSSEPTCDQNDSFTSTGKSINVSSSNNNNWVCFRVKNNNNNDEYGYKKYQIDYNGPIISISQVGTKITAHTDATDLPANPSWKKRSAADTSDCDSATTGFVSGSSFSNVVAAKYYCFKVTDKNGNDGYGEIQIGETPVIVVGQTQTEATASASTTGTLDDDSWQSFKTGDLAEPDCDQSDTLDRRHRPPIRLRSALQRITGGLLSGQDSNNVYGYFKYRYRLQRPRN